MSTDAAGPSPAERRRAPRVPMPPVGGAVSVVGAKIIDVSPYGMRIESPLAIKPDSVLPFRLVIAGQKADVKARVCTCVHAASGGHCHNVGLEFVGIDPAVRERLRDVLSALDR